MADKLCARHDTVELSQVTDFVFNQTHRGSQFEHEHCQCNHWQQQALQRQLCRGRMCPCLGQGLRSFEADTCILVLQVPETCAGVTCGVGPLTDSIKAANSHCISPPLRFSAFAALLWLAVVAVDGHTTLPYRRLRATGGQLDARGHATPTGATVATPLATPALATVVTVTLTQLLSL